jgi:stage II sporulation protein D
MRSYLLALFCLIFPTQVLAAKRGQIPEIKVRLNLKNSVIQLQSESRTLLTREDTNKISQYKPNTKIKIKCRKFQKKKKTEKFASVAAFNKLLKVNGETYKGKISIYKDHNKKRCFVVGQMDLEDYVQSILPTEMSASWPVEALAAQAVAARTYALHRILTLNQSRKNGINYHLENSEKDQVNGSVNDWTKKTLAATKKTRGQVLVNKKRELVPAFFHAKCGGSTLTPGQVWQNSYASYKRVKDPYCVSSGKPYWYHKLVKNDFRKFFRWQLKKQKKYLGEKFGNESIVSDSVYNAYLKIQIDNKSYLIPKSGLRKYFGRYKIQSNHFKILTNSSGDYVLYGRGRGHGVGMCQVGAHMMSKKGKGYKDIISYYYPNLNLVSYLK